MFQSFQLAPMPYAMQVYCGLSAAAGRTDDTRGSRRIPRLPSMAQIERLSRRMLTTLAIPYSYSTFKDPFETKNVFGN